MSFSICPTPPFQSGYVKEVLSIDGFKNSWAAQPVAAQPKLMASCSCDRRMDISLPELYPASVNTHVRSQIIPKSGSIRPHFFENAPQINSLELISWRYRLALLQCIGEVDWIYRLSIVPVEPTTTQTWYLARRIQPAPCLPEGLEGSAFWRQVDRSSKLPGTAHDTLTLMKDMIAPWRGFSSELACAQFDSWESYALSKRCTPITLEQVIDCKSLQFVQNSEQNEYLQRVAKHFFYDRHSSHLALTVGDLSDDPKIASLLLSKKA